MATTQQSTPRTSASKQQTKASKSATSKTPKKTATKSQPAAKKTAPASPRSSNKEKPTEKKTSDVSSSSNETENTKPANTISAEVRSHMIAEAAYYRAAKRGFDGSNEKEDWLVAEAEIDAIINEGKLAALN